MLQVDAFAQEEIEVADVMGQPLTDEIIEVLESEWARKEGWVKDSTGKYTNKISEHVTIEFTLGDGRSMRVRRIASDVVKSNLARTRSHELEGELAEVRDRVNEKVHSVLGRAIALGLKHRAKEQGYEFVENAPIYEQEGPVFEYELRFEMAEEMV